jgi:hypothetical protein
MRPLHPGMILRSLWGKNRAARSHCHHDSLAIYAYEHHGYFRSDAYSMQYARISDKALEDMLDER